MTKLSPTAYALLGLLARRPWSAYELNTQMQRNVLRAFWPRAASHVYSEPKKLVAHKLATAHQEVRNGRERTVYKITRAGREALAAWLEEPAESDVAISFEGMLKFLYAEAADIGVLRANLDAMENRVFADAAFGLEALRPRLEGRDTDGMPYNGMALHLLADVIEARLAWVRETRKQLANLTETGQSEESVRLGMQSYERLVRRFEALLAQRPDGEGQAPAP